MVPLLVPRVPDSGLDEAVYIVFILRELHAVEVEAVVRKLQFQIGMRSVGRDLTLRMQVDYFLRDAHTW